MVPFFVESAVLDFDTYSKKPTCDLSKIYGLEGRSGSNITILKNYARKDDT